MRSAAAVLLPLATLCLTGCAAIGADEQTPAPPGQDRTSSAQAPDACVASAEATRENIEGTPVWARFCPGPEGRTTLAEVPSDALTTHLELLASLGDPGEGEVPPAGQCQMSWGRTYQVQIGYADGLVAQVAGPADPDCAGRLARNGNLVGGPDSLGVYGLLMTAFGSQYADDFDNAASDAPLLCPNDPRKPDSVDVDGLSTSLSTGYHLGQREPMIMPLPAVRGVVCTWPFGAENDAPEVRNLTRDEAERVRIGLHAIPGGTVDCGGSPEPTHTAVIEDMTGTRRAVTIIDSACSTVIRSDQGGGIGFAWLDR